MQRVRFWCVDGEDTSADGGYIEVADDGTVTMSASLLYVADLRAPVDPRDMRSESTCPRGGFEVVREDGDAVVLRPVGEWDAAAWLDKVRYHFRTPYLRPDEVESIVMSTAEAAERRLDQHVDVDQPNDDWVNPVDYWWATGEGWEDISPIEQARLLGILGIPPGAGRSDSDAADTKAE